MAGAHAYVSLAQALKDGEKRLLVLKKVTINSPMNSKKSAKKANKSKQAVIKK
ncbi:MAG: hypothetical protein ACKVOE_08815 [Rickettsiales bacterium]